MNSTDKLSGRALLAAIDLVSLAESYGVTLTKDKAEYVGLCPFHADNHASFYVDKRKTPHVFCCNPCGIGGSPLDFVIRAEQARGNFSGTEKEEQANAFKILEAGVNGGELPRVLPSSNNQVKSPWVVLSPVPNDAPPPVFRHNQRGLASASWAYRNEAGALLGYTARFDLPDGGKDVLPFSYCERDGRRFWTWLGQSVPRPLYGLDKLAKAAPDVPVLIVEGEKTADAANLLFFPDLVALTWAGGSNTVRFADWSALRGRNVIVWRDADRPGEKAMYGYWNLHPKRQPEPTDFRNGVVQFLAAAGALAVKAVEPTDVPEGWDVADNTEWSKEEASAYLVAHLGPVPFPPAPEGLTAPALAAVTVEPETGTVKPAKKKAPALEPEETDWEDEEPEADPYRCLGYRKNSFGQNEFYIYSFKAQQALRFTAANFTKSGLLQLADVPYWEANFSTKAQGYETKAAQYLINSCYAADVYDLESIRGIGAWLDNDKVVVHAGTHLVAEGQEYGLRDFDSPFIYEANRPFGFSLAEPLSDEEASKFAEVIKLLTWERPAYADLFIGWCIVAPVCGALNWRPHIWLTGPAGSGKTTAMKYMRKAVGAIGLPVQGNTTEAAIRQTLNQDARPVLFDEADSDGAFDNVRLQNILSLVRAASSHDGGGIMKGGATGSAQTFLIRSCFAFASITPKVANAADKSRVSVLSLVKPPEMIKALAEEKWAAIEKQLFECFSPERCEQLQARTLSLLPQLLANAKVFSRAATVVLGESRAGDQLGVMLAGEYSLHSSGLIDFDAAKKLVESKDWDEIRNDEKDELMLLSKLMEQQIRVKANNGAEHERTVGELILIAYGGPVGDETVFRADAARRLGRIGFRVEEESLFISNTADWITKILRGTAWATNHGKVLGRLPGATAHKQKYFGPGTKTRAVCIPISILTA